MPLDRKDVVLRLQPVFHDTFGDDSLKIVETSSAADVEDWDSLANVRLMIAVEKAFSIRMKAPEIAAMKNVGDLVSMIISKVA